MPSDVVDREVETLPTEWRKASVADVVAMLPGFAFKSDKFVTDTDAGLPLIRIRDLCQTTAATRYVGDYDEAFAVKDGDILVGMDGEFSAVRWHGGRALLNQRVLKLCTAEQKEMDEGYLFYRVQPALLELEQTISGTTVKHLSTKDLKRLVWQLPPLAEQRRIAEVLRSVDEAITATREVIDQAMSNLEAATSALMVSDSSLSDWRHGRCDSFFVLQRGFDITEAQATPGPYRVISSSGPTYSHSAFAVAGPAVITGRKGRLGTVFYSKDDCWPHDTSLWVKDFKGNHPRFVYWKLRHMDLKAYDAATSVPTLNRNNVHALEIAFPPIAEQIDISETLDAMLLAIEREEGQLVALQAIKSSVSRDLLSGHIRVPA